MDEREDNGARGIRASFHQYSAEEVKLVLVEPKLFVLIQNEIHKGMFISNSVSPLLNMLQHPCIQFVHFCTDTFSPRDPVSEESLGNQMQKRIDVDWRSIPRFHNLGPFFLDREQG